MAGRNLAPAALACFCLLVGAAAAQAQPRVLLSERQQDEQQQGHPVGAAGNPMGTDDLPLSLQGLDRAQRRLLARIRPPPPQPLARQKKPPRPRPPRPPRPPPPPPVSCLTDPLWQAVKERLTLNSAYAGSTDGSAAFPAPSVQPYPSDTAFAPNNVVNLPPGQGLVYSPVQPMWGLGGSLNRTCVWWWSNVREFAKPPSKPFFWGALSVVPSLAQTKWPSMLFVLSDVAPPAFSFASRAGWDAFWDDPSTQFCALVTPGMALARRGAKLNLPCKDASGTPFVDNARFMVGFAIDAASASQAVPRWGSLSWMVGPETLPPPSLPPPQPSPPPPSPSPPPPEPSPPPPI